MKRKEGAAEPQMMAVPQNKRMRNVVQPMGAAGGGTANSPALRAVPQSGQWAPSPFTDGARLRVPTVRKPNPDSWAKYDPTAPEEVEEVCLVGPRDTWRQRVGAAPRKSSAPRIIKQERGDDPYNLKGEFMPQHPDFHLSALEIVITNIVTVLYLEMRSTGRRRLPISPQGVACFADLAQSEVRDAFKSVNKRSEAPRHTEMLFPRNEASVVSTGARGFYQSVWRNQRTLRDLQTFVSPDITGAAPGTSTENIVCTVFLRTPIDFEQLKLDPLVSKSLYFEGYHLVHPDVLAGSDDTINTLIFPDYLVFTGARSPESLRLAVARSLGYASRHASRAKKKN